MQNMNSRTQKDPSQQNNIQSNRIQPKNGHIDGQFDTNQFQKATNNEINLQQNENLFTVGINSAYNTKQRDQKSFSNSTLSRLQESSEQYLKQYSKGLSPIMSTPGTVQGYYEPHVKEESANIIDQFK